MEELGLEEAGIQHRVMARSALIGRAKLAFQYIISYENTIGSLRASERFDEAFVTLLDLYEYALAASGDEAFKEILSEDGKYIYPDRETYYRFQKWVNILYRMRKIYDDWAKDRISRALVYGQIEEIRITALECEKELRKLAGERPPWFTREVEEDLFEKLYGKHGELRVSSATIIQIINIARTVLTLMSPILLDHVHSFKSLIQHELDLLGFSQIMSMSKDFTASKVAGYESET
jgi:hypothetical protein